MKIIYIANARIPTEKAHGIQIMKMCEAFAQNNEVEMILPMRFNRIKEDPFRYYGIGKKFRIKKLPCLDLIRFHRYLGNFGLWLETATFFFSLCFYLIFKKADIFYTRDRLLLPLSAIKRNFIFEAHTFPRNYFLYKFFLRKLKGVVAITQKLKESFIERGLMPDRILTAPDGVDLEKFQISDTKYQIREKLGLPQDRKIALYTGHLYQWKGAQILAEASQYLSENVEIYLVGGTEQDIRKFKSQNSNLEIKVAGHRSHAEIPYWLKAADVLVLPNSGREDISKYWTSPMKLFEYMASERPIVASDLPSIREILNEQNAILVKPDDPQDLCRGINTALGDEVLSSKIADNAFRDVQNYTWQKRVQNIYGYFNLGKK